jgi:sodium-dependent phosphate cotransporter
MDSEVQHSEPIEVAVIDDDQKKKKKIKKKKKKNPRLEDLDQAEKGFQLDNGEFIGDASWLEVCQGCFVHSPKEWIGILFAVVLILLCLYCFGLGLDFLGTGAKVVASCTAGELFGHNTNPVSSVTIGILATVLIQSSSTTTSIIVGLVGGDNGIVSVQQGIYMMMGANIGTTVTNTIVSLGHFSNPEQLGHAFAGATIHDLFNFMSLAVLFPIEICTGYLLKLTAALVRGANTEKGEAWAGPAKKLISPLAARILIANKKVINSVASGGDCDDFYPIQCADPHHPTYLTCTHVGLIGCDKHTGICPAFFSPDASLFEDQVSGFVVFFIGLFVIFTSFFVLAFLVQKLLKGVSIRIIYKGTALNSYLLIAIGAGITMLLQSSSTTTAIFTPVVGVGAMRLEQMFALTIGANVGTTITALLAALVTDGDEALQVALAHLMFNVNGMMILYPIPAVREIPLASARRLGKAAKAWRGFTLVYIAAMFFIIPGTLLGLSAIFTAGTAGLTILGYLLTAFLGILLLVSVRWMYFQGGRQRVFDTMAARQLRFRAIQSLPDDMEKVQKKLLRLLEYAELPQEEKFAPEYYFGISRVWFCYDRRVEESLRNLVSDMKSVELSLPLLFHHLGVPEEFEMEHIDIEVASEQDAIETADNEGSAAKNKGETTESDTVFWKKIPKFNLACFVFGIPLAIYGLIALFLQGSKCAKGAAGFLTIMMVFYSLYTLQHYWIYKNGREGFVEHFESKARRDTAVASLPDDMAQVQADIKRLFIHYKMLPDEKDLKERDPSAGGDTCYDGSSGL